jgi:hypothetical protein
MTKIDFKPEKQVKLQKSIIFLDFHLILMTLAILSFSACMDVGLHLTFYMVGYLCVKGGYLMCY